MSGVLQVLINGWEIAVAIGFYIIEFFADKTPYLDSAWDVAHTFIRVPAGAVLAAQAFGDYDPAIRAIAPLVGGGLALGSRETKAATRYVVELFSTDLLTPAAFAKVKQTPPNRWLDEFEIRLRVTSDGRPISVQVATVFLLFGVLQRAAASRNIWHNNIE